MHQLKDIALLQYNDDGTVADSTLIHLTVPLGDIRALKELAKPEPEVVDTDDDIQVGQKWLPTKSFSSDKIPNRHNRSTTTDDDIQVGQKWLPAKLFFTEEIQIRSIFGNMVEFIIVKSSKIRVVSIQGLRSRYKKVS